MKKVNLLAAIVMVFMCFTMNASAQTPTTFYAGKWDVLLKGTPNGDVHMMMTLTDSVGTLKGTYVEFESKKDVPFSKIEKKDSGIALNFSAQGYDLTLTLEKKDDDHVAGSLMSMFEASGVRVK